MGDAWMGRWLAPVLAAGVLAAGCTAAAAHAGGMAPPGQAAPGVPNAMTAPAPGVGLHATTNATVPGKATTVPVPPPDASQTPPTELVSVHPGTAGSVQNPQYVIVDSGMLDTCVVGTSGLAGAYRCFGGDGVSDPCWVDGAEPAVTKMTCLLHPWDAIAYRYTLRPGRAALVAAETAVPRPTDDPWAVQLETGRRCMVLPGLQESFQGTPETYYCGSDLSLLKGFDRSQPTWTVKSVKTSAGGSLGTLGLERVVKAWYGAADGGLHIPASALPTTARS